MGGGGGTSKKTGSRQGLDAKSKRAQDTGAEEGGDAIRRMIAAQSEVPFSTGACRLARSPPFLGAGGWMCLLGDLVLFFFWAPPRGPSPLIITPPPTAARPHRFRKFGKAVYFFCTLGAVYAKFELRAFFANLIFFLTIDMRENFKTILVAS